MRTSRLRRLGPAAAASAMLAAAFAFAQGNVTPAALIGKPLPDFTLTDYEGKSHTLSQHRDAKGVVLIFVSTRCPVSNAYNQRMVKLAADYQPKGFRFLGVNANKAELPEELAQHARKNDWNFPVLKDTGNKVADQLGATVTPEVYLVDSAGVLRYHGRIDDSQDAPAARQHDLREALDALLAGQEVARKEAKAFGCTIKRG
ncbi:MAG TPA: thioredoxin family protein [Candidatus Polarisedimenticolia bacterium]|nr:thioredoxin family protein [Candidatus Polarisedimenticolia bacterium]